MYPEKHRLSKEEWNQLDQLLDKHGFGGYYDLLECLKMVISRMVKATGKDIYVERIKDIREAIHVLMGLSSFLPKPL